jgi:hypothetical protein
MQGTTSYGKVRLIEGKGTMLTNYFVLI